MYSQENMIGRWFYYVRVSSKSQKFTRQLEDSSLSDFCNRLNIKEQEILILSDTMSGKDFNRPNFELLKQIVRPGDCIVVSSLDRFGRNYIEGRKEFSNFISKGIKVYVLNRPMLEDLYKLNDNMSKFMINFLVDWELLNAEEELKRIKERQEQGIRSAKKNGIKFGRPKVKYDEDLFKVLYSTWKENKITAVEFAKRLNLKSSTFYNIVKAYENRNM
ncbi:TPA: recombinase family protein [Clostridium perfringens]